MPKSEWEGMRISDGVLGFIHKIIMFVTWPFRRWKLLVGGIIVLAAVAIIVPMCYGAKFGDVINWYKDLFTSKPVVQATEKINAVKETAREQIIVKVEDVKQAMQQIMPQVTSDEEEKVEAVKSEPIRFTSWNVAKFNKVKYEKPVQKAGAGNEKVEIKAPTFATLKKQADEQVAAIADEALAPQPQVVQEDSYKPIKQTASYYAGKLGDYYRIRPDLELIYLTEAEKIYHTADVVGANSLYINGVYVYLYGIYTNPDYYDEAEAKQFLEKMLEGKKVHCDIVAYTSQGQAATALCFINGELINKAMVDAGLAKNIALK